MVWLHEEPRVPGEHIITDEESGVDLPYHVLWIVSLEYHCARAQQQSEEQHNLAPAHVARPNSIAMLCVFRRIHPWLGERPPLGREAAPLARCSPPIALTALGPACCAGHHPSCPWFDFVWFLGWSTWHLALDPSSVLYLQHKLCSYFDALQHLPPPGRVGLVLSCLVLAIGAANVPHWGGRRCACSLPLP
jgi:hypothetical protein